PLCLHAAPPSDQGILGRAGPRAGQDPGARIYSHRMRGELDCRRAVRRVGDGLTATLAAAALVAFLASPLPGAEPATDTALPRSTPERQGISPSAILAFVEAADSDIDAMHSFMLVRHGHVVAEGWWTPYDAKTPHVLYSLSKSFTSTAVGLAITEGKLSLDDEVLKMFPEDAPAEPSS